MFSNTVLDSLATFGYLLGFLGLGFSVIAYFAIPKLLTKMLGSEENDEDCKD